MQLAPRAAACARVCVCVCDYAQSRALPRCTDEGSTSHDACNYA
jgi:hypothetical protein